MSGHSRYVTFVTVTPDGKYIVSGSFDKSIRIWNLYTASHIAAPNAHKESV